MTTRRTLFGLGAGLAALAMSGAGAIARTLTKPHRPPKGMFAEAEERARAELSRVIGVFFPEGVSFDSATYFVENHLAPALEQMMEVARCQGMPVRYIRVGVENGRIRIDAMERDEEREKLEAYLDYQRDTSAG